MSQDTYFSKKALTLIGMVLLQSLVVILNTHWSYFYANKLILIPARVIQGVSFVSSLVIGLISIFLIKELVRLANRDKEAELQKLYLKGSQEFIDILRIHRHDYMNHLQVIMGSIQLKRSEYALDYIKEVIEELKTESRISNIKHPEIAALLLKKKQQAEEKAIPLEIDLESDLKGLKLPTTDLIRIVGNLIDNALHAVKDVTNAERKVEVLFAEDEKEFTFEVFNKKPVIPENMQEVIFQKGYTTKGIEGSGLGLYIVKELVEKNAGFLSLVSNEEEGTTFTVRFPKDMNE